MAEGSRRLGVDVGVHGVQLEPSTVQRLGDLLTKRSIALYLCLVDGNNPLTAFTVSNLVRQAIVVKLPSTLNTQLRLQ